jgi:alpha-amylase/alpha-mannosidase (GH57 family)
VSQPTIDLAAEAGFEWLASGGAVLQNSHEHDDDDCSHRVYRFGGAGVDCMFRDDGLSDLIGFTYSDWDATDAVVNLVSHMENIAEVCPDRDNCLITIILDGENAWEHYPENAHHFLSELYSALAKHPALELTTFSRFREEKSPVPLQAEQLIAGSWVYGSFSTWIGHEEKNRAWELLVEAKQAFDTGVASGLLSSEEIVLAEKQLAICEGSDWFWWFGDYNPSDSVVKFDQLYRMHLANLYHLLHIEPPQSLSEVISQGGGHPTHGGVMRHHSESGSS